MVCNMTAILSKNAGFILSTFHNLASFSTGCWCNTLRMMNRLNTEQVHSLISLHHTLNSSQNKTDDIVCCSSKHANITQHELHSFIYIMD
jgi:hypothetical protein